MRNGYKLALFTDYRGSRVQISKHLNPAECFQTGIGIIGKLFVPHPIDTFSVVFCLPLFRAK